MTIDAMTSELEAVLEGEITDYLSGIFEMEWALTVSRWRCGGGRWG
ncbi:hypothetical protein ACFCYB_18075 [Streptomyces sp. NPDC056309]